MRYGPVGACSAKRRGASLFFAVADGDIDTVDGLLAERADPNATSFFGLTLLHITVRVYSRQRASYRCAERWSSITKLLLEAGADPMALDFRDTTAAAWGDGFTPPRLRDALMALAERGVWLDDDRDEKRDWLGLGGPAVRLAAAHERLAPDTLEALIARATVAEKKAKKAETSRRPLCAPRGGSSARGGESTRRHVFDTQAKIATREIDVSR